MLQLYSNTRTNVLWFIDLFYKKLLTLRIVNPKWLFFVTTVSFSLIKNPLNYIIKTTIFKLSTAWSIIKM